MIIKSFLSASILFLFAGCFSNENFYEGFKHSKKMQDGRYPKESGLVPEDKKDQSYKEYVDEVEKSKF